MPRRKPKTRHGASQPEEERVDPSTLDCRAVPGQPDYVATRDGRIVRLSTGRVLRPAMNAAGYLVCATRSESGWRTHQVHTLVLSAWSGPRPAGQEARHLDGDRHNNASANLAWGTRAENAADKAQTSPEVRARMRLLPSHSGPTQPEEEREAQQVKLRLPPAELARLDRLRSDRGMQRSAYVIRLVRMADGIDPEFKSS